MVLFFTEDVGSVDLLCPILRWDLLKGDRYGFLAIARCAHRTLRNLVSEPLLVLLGLPWPKLHNDMWQLNLLSTCTYSDTMATLGEARTMTMPL